ncbi:hypothetical protein Ga0100231_002210 [Opitutaceae bacterium TAV4]|nr:hypothetical protein Ga0100231_002210 [Opitutaceae bacterium TAV4]RRK01774.1 hypothetical protein Ga0100230_000400 [Opitutaceae bacterium TAV3]
MSLNRTEQTLFDYLRANPEERRHWESKVRTTATACSGDIHEASILLDSYLWDYYRERSEVASPFREIVAREGLQRTSLRNLADYLIRLWAPPPPKKRPAGYGM